MAMAAGSKSGPLLLEYLRLGASRSGTSDITAGAITLANHCCQAVSGCATDDAPDVGLDLADNWVTLWQTQGLSRI